jgi:hypothetical protein
MHCLGWQELNLWWCEMSLRIALGARLRQPCPVAGLRGRQFPAKETMSLDLGHHSPAAPEGGSESARIGGQVAGH